MKKGVLLILAEDPFLEPTPYELAREVIPTHLLLLGSVLKKNSDLNVKILEISKFIHRVKSCDLEGYHQFEDGLQNIFTKYIEDFKYFGISVYGSTTYLCSLSIAKILKKLNPNCVVIGGGYHPTFKVSDFLFKNSPFDILIRGEADTQLLDTIKAIEDGIIKINHSPKVVESKLPPLDNLPSIDWDIFDFSQLNGAKTIEIPYYSSRGCPFSCSFCCKQSNTMDEKNKWRPLPVSRVMAEINTIRDRFDHHKIDLYFYDPIWGLQSKWRQEMLDALISNQFPVRMFLELRIDSVKNDDLEKIAKLNSIVSFGLESGSPTMLKIMNKTPNPVKYLSRMMEIANFMDNLNSYWRTPIIFGHPGENSTTITESFNYITRLYEDKHYGFPHINYFGIFPGSPIYYNMDHYQKTFGTQFIAPKWYYYPTHQRTINLTNPSAELSIYSLLDLLHQWQHKFFDIIKNNFKIIQDRATEEFITFLKIIDEQKDYPKILIKQEDLSSYKMTLNLVAKRFWEQFFNLNFPSDQIFKDFS